VLNHLKILPSVLYKLEQLKAVAEPGISDPRIVVISQHLASIISNSDAAPRATLAPDTCRSARGCQKSTIRNTTFTIPTYFRPSTHLSVESLRHGDEGTSGSQ
jgi:hypothetical protein